MKRLKVLIILIFCCQSVNVIAQSKQILEDINSDIWEPFSTAYSNLNFELFDSIHHKDFLRINGNNKSIKSRSEYLGQYQTNWEDSGRQLSIQFRFLERIHNNSFASERGIYKMTINPGTNNAQSYYGKFHVIIKHTDLGWKLLVDYDSDERSTIGEEDFKNAYAKDNFNAY